MNKINKCKIHFLCYFEVMEWFQTDPLISLLLTVINNEHILQILHNLSLLTALHSLHLNVFLAKWPKEDGKAVTFIEEGAAA